MTEGPKKVNASDDANVDDLFSIVQESREELSGGEDVLPLSALEEEAGMCELDLEPEEEISAEDIPALEIEQELLQDELQEPSSVEKQEENTAKPLQNDGAQAPAEQKPKIFSEHKKVIIKDAPASTSSASAAAHQESHKISLPSEFFSDKCTLGQFLKEARTMAGYTLADVARYTRIRTDYMEAMERDDVKRLPPSVYIAAYVRALCSLYNLDKKSSDFAAQRLRETMPPSDVPEKLVLEVRQELEVNQEEEKRIRKIMYIILAGILITAILISWVIFAFFFSGRNGASSGAASGGVIQTFNPESLETLNPPEMPNIDMLDIRN